MSCTVFILISNEEIYFLEEDSFLYPTQIIIKKWWNYSTIWSEEAVDKDNERELGFLNFTINNLVLIEWSSWCYQKPQQPVAILFCSSANQDHSIYVREKRRRRGTDDVHSSFHLGKKIETCMDWVQAKITRKPKLKRKLSHVYGPLSCHYCWDRRHIWV